MPTVRVRDIMSTELVTLAQEEDLSLADTIMSLARIRHLPVVRDGVLLGLVTHRDILRAQLDRSRSFSQDQAIKRAIKAGEIMTRKVTTVTPDTSLLAAARLIRDQKLGCLPVVDGSDGRLVGLVTEADFVGFVIDALQGMQDPQGSSAG